MLEAVCKYSSKICPFSADSSVNSWSSWSGWSSCFDAGNGRKQHSQRFCFRDDLSECPGADREGVESRERTCKNGKYAIHR